MRANVSTQQHTIGSPAAPQPGSSVGAPGSVIAAGDVMTVPSRYAVPLHCPHCGGALEIGIESDAAQTVQFNCPYCGTTRRFDAPGHVLYVAARQLGEHQIIRH